MSFWDFSRFVSILGPTILVALFIFTAGRHLSLKIKIAHIVFVNVILIFLGFVTLPFMDYFVEHSDRLPMLWWSTGIGIPVVYCFIMSIVMLSNRPKSGWDLRTIDEKPNETLQTSRKFDPTITAAIISAIASIVVAIISKIL